MVPQGNLAERIRAAGAGIGAFFCPTGVGTPLAEGKETRTIDGRDYVLEYPIRGDVALIGAHVGRPAGNLLYRKTARNFGPVMATAAALTIVEVARVVDAGEHRPRDGGDPRHLRRPGRRLSRSDATEAARDQPSRRPSSTSTAGRWTARNSPPIVARDIPPGSYVNLGIGQPTTVAEYLDPAAGVVLHTENGMLGMGGAAFGDDIDPDLTNAGKIPVTETPGASYFHHADSFAMMRGGHLDVCVLGRLPGQPARGPRELAHRCARRHPRRRRRDGPRHRRQARVRDDEPVRQGRHRQTGRRVHLSADRAALRQPGLHRTRDFDIDPAGEGRSACARRSVSACQHSPSGYSST